MAEALLLEVGVMFAVIAAAGAIAGRMGLSSIPFYILAGLLVNPSAIGRLGLPSVGESAFVAVGAELGIVLLLFFLGLEFDPGRLAADRERMGKAGVIDLGINFGIGLLLGFLLFGGVVATVLFAGIVYVSSSAVITKSLLDLGWIANPESGPLLGTLVFEDLAIAVYLALVSALVFGGGDLASAARGVALALGFVALLVVLVYAGTALVDRAVRTTATEDVVLRTLGITVPVAGAALVVGVSEAVAAFFVGMAFSTTDAVHTIEEVLSPLRDTFAAVFFFWIGLVTDPAAVLGVVDLVLLVALVTGPAKVASGFYGGQAYGLSAARSLRVGLSLVIRGEFSLIIAAAAVAGAGVALDPATADTLYAFTVGYVLLLSIVGTVLMQSSGRFERFVG